MKKLFCLLAVVGMLFTACEPDSGIDSGDPDNNGNQTEQPGGGNQGGNNTPDTPEIPDDAYITLNKEIVNFSPDGESIDIKVYSNYKWTLTNNCDWITTSATSGEASEDGATITLTAEHSYDDREGTITFSCGNAKKLIVVSQSLKETIIADENNTFNVSVDGGTVELAYQTTVECEVIIPEEAQSWISLASAEARALVSEVATLNVAKNNTGAQRSAVVKVVKKDDSSLCVEYTITQERNMDYVILYTTSDGNPLIPYYSFSFECISNTYEDGVGMLAFDGDVVTTIEAKAFYLCLKLTSITIPKSITSIGDYAFEDCKDLTSITIPESVTSIGEYAFSDCTKLTSVTIANGVTSIGKNAFEYCKSLTHITIPESVTSIGEYAFSDCYSLTSITIPEGVTSIERLAFYNCIDLTSITIPSSITSISNYLFEYCISLTSITIPNSVTSIGHGAFKECYSLTRITIPNSVTSIGNNAFSSCCFEREGFINNSSIDAEANNYWGAEFVDIIMEDGLYINGTVAVGCSPIATNITIPGSVTSIKDLAFLEKTSLQSVTIENGVTSIGMMAFADCSSLRNVTISESVTSIGWMAFRRCFSLRKVYCKPITPPAGDSDMFDILAGNSFNIYVPASDDDSIINAYKVAEGWSNYAYYISEYEFD